MVGLLVSDERGQGIGPEDFTLDGIVGRGPHHTIFAAQKLRPRSPLVMHHEWKEEGADKATANCPRSYFTNATGGLNWASILSRFGSVAVWAMWM